MGDNSSIGSVAIIVGVVAVVAVAGFMLYARSKNSGSSIQCIQKDSLSMKEVIEYFKNPIVLNQLQSNNNLIAVAIKESLKDGRIKVILTLFDKSKDKIIENPNAKGYEVREIDSDLKDSFGSKDMIVLQ